MWSYTEKANQKTHRSVNSTIHQNRVNNQLHQTRVTYQRSFVTQAWWWGWPPVTRGRIFNLLCKIKIEWAMSMFVCYYETHLEFPPGVELLQAFHSLLSVHHGSHSRALLWKQTGKRFRLYLDLHVAVFLYKCSICLHAHIGEYIRRPMGAWELPVQWFFCQGLWSAFDWWGFWLQE